MTHLPFLDELHLPWLHWKSHSENQDYFDTFLVADHIEMFADFLLYHPLDQLHHQNFLVADYSEMFAAFKFGEEDESHGEMELLDG